jgi:hypothetical protein
VAKILSPFGYAAATDAKFGIDGLKKLGKSFGSLLDGLRAEEAFTIR